MTRSRWPLAFSLILAATAATTTSCSPGGDELPREAVSGTVNLDGGPLASGVIQFNPKAGSTTAVAGGSPIEAGHFAIPRETGLVPGHYTVSINAAADRELPKTKGRLLKGAGLAKETIPTKYNAKTELDAEVKKGGPNVLTFDLQSK